MIVAEPLAMAVTSPAEETVAAVVSDDDHVTVVPDMVLPPESLTVAASVAVSPTEVKLKVAGEMEIDVGTGIVVGLIHGPSMSRAVNWM